MEVAFGILAGVVSGLGMGGGSILIVLLSLFSGMNQHYSQGTNLVFFIPTSVVTILVNIKNKNINWKIAFQIVIFGIMGALVRQSFFYRIFFIFDEKGLCIFFDFYYIL